MKKIILMGRTGSGKTTLAQALQGKAICQQKTQDICHMDWIIDTPGELSETRMLGGALAVYSYEADLVGLLMAANEPFSLYPPNITSMVNREVVGIVTQIHHPDANTGRVEAWLRLSGCKRVFFVDSVTGQGMEQLMEYLRKPGEIN